MKSGNEESGVGLSLGINNISSLPTPFIRLRRVQDGSKKQHQRMISLVRSWQWACDMCSPEEKGECRGQQ